MRIFLLDASLRLVRANGAARMLVPVSLWRYALMTIPMIRVGITARLMPWPNVFLMNMTNKDLRRFPCLVRHNSSVFRPCFMTLATYCFSRLKNLRQNF